MNRTERRAWNEGRRAEFARIPAGYEPELWDVTKDQAIAVVIGVSHDAAQEACHYLNQNNRPHEYELVLHD